MRAGTLPGNTSTHTALSPLSEAERGSGPNEEGGAKIKGKKGEGGDWRCEWKDSGIPQGGRLERRMEGQTLDSTAMCPVEHWISG